MHDGVITLRGRLDASQAEKADKAFSFIYTSTTVDASELEYISSAGLSVFVKTLLRLQPRGHTLRIVNPHPRVHAVFHYSNLAPLFQLE